MDSARDWRRSERARANGRPRLRGCRHQSLGHEGRLPAGGQSPHASERLKVLSCGQRLSSDGTGFLKVLRHVLHQNVAVKGPGVSIIGGWGPYFLLALRRECFFPQRIFGQICKCVQCPSYWTCDFLLFIPSLSIIFLDLLTYNPHIPITCQTKCT